MHVTLEMATPGLWLRGEKSMDTVTFSSPVSILTHDIDTGIPSVITLLHSCAVYKRFCHIIKLFSAIANNSTSLSRIGITEFRQ